MKQFWQIAKYILTFASLTGVIWGVFEIVDTLKDADKDQKEFQTEIVLSIDKTSMKIDSVLSMVKKVNNEVSKNSNAIEAGQRATRYIIEHQAEMTREQQLDFFDFYMSEIKKNGGQTVLRE